MEGIFKITIELVRNEEVVQPRRWIGKSEDKTEDVYSPEFTKTEEVSRKVYYQEAKDLNLIKVINAVNDF